MATPYGDISPRTAALWARKLLEESRESILTNCFKTTYADEDPVVVDPLLYCTGRCHSWRPCPLQDVHTEDEAEEHWCANYEGQVIDSMVGEAYGGTFVGSHL